MESCYTAILRQYGALILAFLFGLVPFLILIQLPRKKGRKDDCNFQTEILKTHFLSFFLFESKHKLHSKGLLVQTQQKCTRKRSEPCSKLTEDQKTSLTMFSYSSLLTLNTFYTFFTVSLVKLKHIFVLWSGLCFQITQHSYIVLR